MKNKMIVYRSCFLFLFMFLFIVSGDSRVLAADGNTGYFDQSTVYNDDLGAFVLADGLNTTDKATFISTIINYRNGLSSAQNKVGAEFIIQTMRGGTDHERPTDADVEDWRARINNDQIMIDTGSYNYSITSYIPPENTDDVTYRNKGSTANAMRFYNINNPSKVLYAIDTHCGNPLGKLSGIPKTRTDITVDPPSPIYYDNSGCRPRKISVTPSMAYDSAGNYGAVPVKVTFSYPASPGVPAVNDTIGIYSSYSEVNLDPKYSVAEDNMKISYIEQRDSYKKVTTTVVDVDTNEVISTTVSYVLDHSAETKSMTPQKCYNYKLETSVSDDRDDVIDGDVLVKAYPVVKNTAAIPVYPVTKTRNTKWALTEMVYSPGTNVSPIKSLGSGAHENTNNPCDYFRNKIPGSTYDACFVPTTNVSQGMSIYNTGVNSLPFIEVLVGDYQVGTMVCFSFSVMSDSSEKSNEYYHSDAICHKISKKPKTQILGGDLLVGRATSTSAAKDSNVATSISSKTIGTFGSWIEYGILASGSVSGAASGAAFQSPATGSSNTCKYSTLTFSNTNNTSACNGALGKYKNSRIIPDVAARYKISTGTQLYSGVSSTTPSGIYKVNGDTTIDGATVNAGQWIVLNASGHKVTISNNINYNNSFTDIKSIPQLVIIAGNIKINDNVTNIDAWLVSSGEINTCSNVTGNLNSNMCNNKLTVNGPVMAKTLNLRRTAGSGVGLADSGTPAEVFNFRADALLWAYNQSASDTTIKTTYNTELPPRL